MSLIKKILLILFLLALFVITLIAASDNSDGVRLMFLDYQTWEWPVSWWMLIAFIIGVTFGIVLNTVSNTRLRLHARRVNKALAKTNVELDRTRAEVE